MKRVFLGTVIFVVIACVGAGLWLAGYLPSFEEIQSSRDAFSEYAMSMPILAGMVFSLLYIAIVALSIPLATPLSLLAGFIFGTLLGTLIVVISATLGATLIFILARYFFREYFLEKLGSVGEQIKHETAFNGLRDILIARLVPAVPFSLINIAAGLTHVRLRDYVIATFFGIIPFSFVYVHAGEALGEIESIRDIATGEGVTFLTRIAVVVAALYLVKRYFDAKKEGNEGH